METLEDGADLPDEIFVVIFSFLEPLMCYFTISKVCKRYKKIVDHEGFWMIMTRVFSGTHEVHDVNSLYEELFDSTAEKRFRAIVESTFHRIISSNEDTASCRKFVRSGQYSEWECPDDRDGVSGWGDYYIALYYYAKRMGGLVLHRQKKKKKRKKEKTTPNETISSIANQKSEAEMEFSSRLKKINNSFKCKKSRSAKKNKGKKIKKLEVEMNIKYSSLIEKGLSFDRKTGKCVVKSVNVNEEVEYEENEEGEQNRREKYLISSVSTFSEFVGKCAVEVFKWSGYDKPKDILEGIQFWTRETGLEKKNKKPVLWEDLLGFIGEGFETKKHLRGIRKGTSPLNYCFLTRTGNETFICAEASNGFYMFKMLTS